MTFTVKYFKVKKTCKRAKSPLKFKVQTKTFSTKRAGLQFAHKCWNALDLSLHTDFLDSLSTKDRTRVERIGLHDEPQEK